MDHEVRFCSNVAFSEDDTWSDACEASKQCSKHFAAFDQAQKDTRNTAYKYHIESLTSRALEENLLREVSVSPCSSVGGLSAPAHARLRITASTSYAH